MNKPHKLFTCEYFSSNLFLQAVMQICKKVWICAGREPTTTTTDPQQGMTLIVVKPKAIVGQERTSHWEVLKDHYRPNRPVVIVFLLLSEVTVWPWHQTANTFKTNFSPSTSLL